MLNRARKLLVPLFGLGAAALLPMCGSSSSPEPGAAARRICDPGRQIECACGQGQTGAQACNANGTAYSACACEGTPIVTAGNTTGGTTSMSNAGTAAGGISGGGGSETSDGGMGGAGGADDMRVDDPCVDHEMFVNCSTTCKDPRYCAMNRCGAAHGSQIVLLPPVQAGEVAFVRTPSAPGMIEDPACETCQDGPSPIATFVIQVDGGTIHKFEVDPPWFLLPIDVTHWYPDPLCSSSGVQCVGSFSGRMVVATMDSNAPAREIRITWSDDPEACTNDDELGGGAQ